MQARVTNSIGQAHARILAVAGDPVAHSLSPAMHNAAIAALGLDAVYVAARTTPRALPGLVYALLEAGGALNVTVPFKRQAAGLVTHPTELVTRTGACNTIWGDAEEPHGDNTDVTGIRTALRALMEDRAVERAVILGTGGSARAVAVAVTEEWPGVEILVASRDPEHARDFVAWAKGAGVQATGTWMPADPGEVLLVNATPVGLSPDDPLPMDEDALGRTVCGGVLDLVYTRGETRLVRAARARGLAASDGRGILVAQGAAAFERFFGVQPPVEVMRAAVEDALRP